MNNRRKTSTVQAECKHIYYLLMIIAFIFTIPKFGNIVSGSQLSPNARRASRATKSPVMNTKRFLEKYKYYYSSYNEEFGFDKHMIFDSLNCIRIGMESDSEFGHNLQQFQREQQRER